jgi:hypothetical protein
MEATLAKLTVFLLVGRQKKNRNMALLSYILALGQKNAQKR